MKNLFQELFESYEKFRQKSIFRRRITHQELKTLLESYFSELSPEKIGISFSGKSIFKIQWGKGETKVLLWSQMHGNESTATLALLDIFNFLISKEFSEIKNQIYKKCTLIFIPMLNPDGADEFQRRTAQGIDMNRDALALQTPEGQILTKICQEFKPDFAFNLHDQSPRYTVGNTSQRAAITFLATAFNENRSNSPTRLRSMQLISGEFSNLNLYIEGKVSRFSDEYEPRAFGDHIQKQNISLILIESGGFDNDPEKQFLRKLNFCILLSSIFSISQKNYEKFSEKDYLLIPENQKKHFDILIKAAQFRQDSTSFMADIGINRYEIPKKYPSKSFQKKWIVEDFGDLSIFHGIQEIEASSLIFPENYLPKIEKKIDSILMNFLANVLHK